MERLWLALRRIANSIFIDQHDKRPFWKRMFGPVHTVGDKKRTLQNGERDGDDEHLSQINKEWRRMLREDEWQVKLMTHVSLLINVSGLLFLVFFFSGLFLPAKHSIFTIVLFANLATLPYWIWAAVWRKRTVERVKVLFSKKFGKHFHWF